MRRLLKRIRNALGALIDDPAPILGGDLDVNGSLISDTGGNGIRVRSDIVRSDVATAPTSAYSDMEIIQNTFTALRLVAINDTPGDGSELYLQRARNELGSETEPQDGDSLGAIFMVGNDGGAWGSSASIAAVADGNHGIGSTPGKLSVSTTPSGSTTLTVADQWDALQNRFTKKGQRLEGVVSPAQITGNVDDYNPTGLSQAAVLRLDSDGAYDITGLTAQDAGTLIHVFNVGSNDLTLKDEDVSSSAANRFALNADLVLGSDQGVTIWYDGTSSRWRALDCAVPAP